MSVQNLIFFSLQQKLLMEMQMEQTAPFPSFTEMWNIPLALQIITPRTGHGVQQQAIMTWTDCGEDASYIFWVRNP